MDVPGSYAVTQPLRHRGMAAPAPHNLQQAAASPLATSQSPCPPMIANKVRLRMIAKRLHMNFSGSISLDAQELFYLVISLARCIDYALSHNDIPERGVLHCLFPIIKQVYQCQNQSDTSLQTAIMALMIAVKNACAKEWFPNSDAKELLDKTNELYSSFCMSVSNTIAGSAQVIIYKILPRFYPQYQFQRVIVSLEAKPGYDVLVADFSIQRNIPPDERICLLVAQMDNLETSSCIINPQHVSFLVNGKGVARRTNSSMDTGPQFPSDITSMLKYGMNILQAIGYFTGNYVIAIAFLSMIATPTAARLEDYVQPVTQTMVSDSDIIEGPSRISLNCPISFKRIKTPVKGRLCNHHQCFDYDNFMELNSRKPSWRCPCCNTSTSCIELRIDQKIVKVLQEVGEDETDIVIFSNGSWKTSFEYRGVNQLHGGKSGKEETSMENGTVASTDVVNLVMEENYLPDRTKSLDRGENGNSELEDRKPFRESNDNLDPLYNSSSANTSLHQSVTCHTASSICPMSLAISDNALGTLESLVPSVLLNPAHADAIPPAENQGTTDFGVSHASVNFNYEPRLSNLSESMPLQSLHARSSISTNEAGRSPIPNIPRIPTITHALPSQTPSSVSLPRLQTATPSRFSSVIGNVQFNELARANYAASTAMRSTALGHHHQSNTAVQQVANLAAANHISTQAPPIHLRGMGAYRGNNQSQRRHSVTNPSSASLSSWVQQPSTNPAHSTLGQSSCNIPLSAQRVAHAHSLTARIPSTREAFLPSLDIGRPLPSVFDHLPDLPIEQNWQPTGRMRGSLTGNAFQAALNHHTVTQTSQAPIPPFSASVSTNEKQPSIANMISCQDSEWMTDFK
ncbi:E4 SUMO-protein ligase PIAL2-like isoform X2 [Zingiber officinale]|uniref:E4 SUMO-protein ligase PIAL2-like isoform X2 n=1 Tax=Zingiber officinale TaxID=94328 RepID=UPI001C4D0ED3|nr:E4 SUMO-protein ligase PIAL2-like isoform X2 [Zingiber officinale]